MFRILITGSKLCGKSSTINAIAKSFVAQSNSISKYDKMLGKSTESAVSAVSAYEFDIKSFAETSGLHFSSDYENLTISEYNINEIIAVGKLSDEFKKCLQKTNMILYVMDISKDLFGSAELKIVKKILRAIKSLESRGIFVNIIFTFNRISEYNASEHEYYENIFKQKFPEEKYFFYDSHLILAKSNGIFVDGFPKEEITRITRADNYYAENNVLAFNCDKFTETVNNIINGSELLSDKYLNYLHQIKKSVNNILSDGEKIDLSEFKLDMKRYIKNDHLASELINIAENNYYLIVIFNIEKNYIEINADSPTIEKFNTFFNLYLNQVDYKLPLEKLSKWLVCYSEEIDDLIDDASGYDWSDNDDNNILLELADGDSTNPSNSPYPNSSIVEKLVDIYPELSAVRNLYDMMQSVNHNFIVKQHVKSGTINFSLYNFFGDYLPNNLELYNIWYRRDVIHEKCQLIANKLNYGKNIYLVLFTPKLREMLLSDDSITEFIGNPFDKVLAEYLEIQNTLHRNKIVSDLI